MNGFKPIVIVLSLLAALHAFGMVWCISGGLDAARSDSAAFHTVADPLKSKGDITDAGMAALVANVEKRSKVHATVMFSYAAVHGITAIGCAVGAVALRRAGRKAI